jgi:hypothetical protein
VRRKTLEQVLHEADPDLKVISGRKRRHSFEVTQQEPLGESNKPSPMTAEDWERAEGELCPNCGQETLRLVDGLCPTCSANVKMEKEEKLERKTERRYYKEQVRKGTISLSRLRQGSV